MAFSTQREVSDGTLVDVRLQIEFIDREDINVFVDDVPKYVGVDWDWVNDTLFQMRVPVPAGQELLVQRSTALDGVLNVFVAGASFDDPTMDENFRQMLFIAQEAREGATLEEIFNNLNMHGYKVTNMGAGTEPGDAINYQQYMDDALGAGAARNQAQAAAAAALGYRDAAAASAVLSDQRASEALTHRNAANASATAAAGSATASQTSRLASEAARDAALGYRDAASASATASQTSANASAASAVDANNALLGVRGAAVPTGSVQFWPGLRSNIPQGYIPLDGQISLRSEYPSIWALVVAGAFASTTDAIWLAGNRGHFSTGDGSTTFRWPDYNAFSHTDNPGGFFLRGGRDNKLALVTQDALQGHKHRSSSYSSTAGATDFNTIFRGDTSTLTQQGAYNGLPNTGYAVYTSTGNVPDGTNGLPRIANETRPVNVSGVWIMKAFGEVLNPGSYDAAAASVAISDLQARMLTTEVRDSWQYSTTAAVSGVNSVDFVDTIPAWATEVEIILSDIGVNATVDYGIQIYKDSVIKTSGYSGLTHALGQGVAGSTWSDSLRVTYSAYEASRRLNGIIRLSLRGGVGTGGTWLINGQSQSNQVGVLSSFYTGVVILGSGRWGIRFRVTTNTTNTFSAGDICIRWRR